MNNQVRLLLAVIALGILASAVAAVRGEEAIEPKAEKVVRAMTDHVKGLQRFRVKVTSEMNMTMQGMSQTMNTVSSLAVERPNKLAMVLEEGMMGVTMISDGTKVYSYFPMFGDKYLVRDAPKTLDNLAEEALGGEGMDTGMGMEGGSFEAFLFASNPYEKLMDGVEAVRYVGEADLDGVRSHHLAFTHQEMDWELWVRADREPLPLRVVPDMAKLFEEMGDMPGAQNMKIEMVVRFDDWSLNAPLPDDQFVFVPPPGAERAESMLDLFDGGGFEAQEHALVGKAAPAFSLDLLAGGRAELAAHRDKDVVILDFWATWCKPCVQAMPALIEVAAEYADRGVVFYAVNLMEEPEKVRRFLEKKKFDLRVPLDRKGKVADLYGVQGIPQTVLIDKKGTVQVVHVGFIPGLGEKLAEELEALLAGKDLTETGG